jgi:site-specific recombinase XerD
MKAFASWLHEHDRMEKTISAYLQDLRHYSQFFQRVNGCEFSPELLNASDVKAYFKGQDEDRSVAPRSRNRRLASLRVMVEWAVEEGLLEYDPTVSIKRQMVEVMPRDRSAEEMERLSVVVINGEHIRRVGESFAWLGLRDRILWALFTDPGLRISEVATLTRDDVDFAARQIHVMGKGGKKAVIDVPERFVEMISEWLEHSARFNPEGRLVTDWNGDAITTGQIRRRILMIGEAAGIMDLQPHELRHTYAYLLLETLIAQGLSVPAALDALRKQMRHTDQKTTLQYFAARGSQIRAAVEAM